MAPLIKSVWSLREVLLCSVAVCFAPIAMIRFVTSANAGILKTQSTSPFSCGRDPKDRTYINCDVVANDVTITGITLNRGNCPSPFPTDQERNEVAAKLRSLPAGESMMLVPVLPFLVLQNASGSCGTIRSENDKEVCELAPTIQKVLSIPQTTYKFGDHFYIPLSLCDNLLEWTISTSSGDWTWSTNQ